MLDRRTASRDKGCRGRGEDVALIEEKAQTQGKKALKPAGGFRFFRRPGLSLLACLDGEPDRGTIRQNNHPRRGLCQTGVQETHRGEWGFGGGGGGAGRPTERTKKGVLPMGFQSMKPAGFLPRM